MLQAAEDVLNLLSQEGVFVDELAMEPVDAAAWRRFMAGVRGAEVAGLGGIRDERALETARGLMKSDSIFRDSALFFQRRFDGVLGEFAGEASDAEHRRSRRHPLGPRLHAARPAERLARLRAKASRPKVYADSLDLERVWNPYGNRMAPDTRSG